MNLDLSFARWIRGSTLLVRLANRQSLRQGITRRRGIRRSAVENAGYRPQVLEAVRTGPRITIAVGFLLAAAAGLYQVGLVLYDGVPNHWPLQFLYGQEIIGPLIFLPLVWSWWWMIKAVSSVNEQSPTVRRAAFGFALVFLMYALVEISNLLLQVELSNGSVDWQRPAISAATSLGFLIVSAGFLSLSVNIALRQTQLAT